jgi:hypothetical protein
VFMVDDALDLTPAGIELREWRIFLYACKVFLKREGRAKLHGVPPTISARVSCMVTRLLRAEDHCNGEEPIARANRWNFVTIILRDSVFSTTCCTVAPLEMHSDGSCGLFSSTAGRSVPYCPPCPVCCAPEQVRRKDSFAILVGQAVFRYDEAEGETRLCVYFARNDMERSPLFGFLRTRFTRLTSEEVLCKNAPKGSYTASSPGRCLACLDCSRARRSAA